MKLLIGITTYKRKNKLERCLNSIFLNDYPADIAIVCDNNDTDTAKMLSEKYADSFEILIQNKHKFVIGAWNRVVQEIFIKKEYDGFIGLCDDVELFPTALSEIAHTHELSFPDTDGVVGFKQSCVGRPDYTFKWFGQTLMGRKFIERYKSVDYQICCPDYFHFCQDEEMFNFALSLGKFKICPKAEMNHYHPAFVPQEMDETHNIIRFGPLSPKDHDFKMQTLRQNKGYNWGNDFKLIGRTQ